MPHRGRNVRGSSAARRRKNASKKSTDPDRRRYVDSCASAHALELIGARWAALVLHELMFGPQRFTELRDELNGISAQVLTARLRELQQSGLVRKVDSPRSKSVQAYEATEWALDVAPILAALSAWASHGDLHIRLGYLSPASLMLELQFQFRQKIASAIGFEARIGFRFEKSTFVADVTRSSIAVSRAGIESVDACFEERPATLAKLFFLGLGRESVRVSGDSALADRFATLFSHNSDDALIKQ
jgi:DNA-binding HxlR family transcriptional regulator